MTPKSFKEVQKFNLELEYFSRISIVEITLPFQLSILRLSRLILIYMLEEFVINLTVTMASSVLKNCIIAKKFKGSR